MKKDEIEAGKHYTDGTGNIRLVLAVGREYVLYFGQGNTDCLRYRLIEKKKGPGIVGREQNSTRISFAAWAKNVVQR